MEEKLTGLILFGVIFVCLLLFAAVVINLVTLYSEREDKKPDSHKKRDSEV